MSISGFMIGLVSGIGLLLSQYSFFWLAWFDWLNVFFASFGLILSIIGVIKGINRVTGILGLALCAIVLVSSFIKLI